MSKSPRKTGTLKRTHRRDSNLQMDETEFDPESLPKPKRSREDPDGIDLSDIGTLVSDTEQDWNEVENIFANKFKEQSPSSKLSRSFGFVGLKESNLLKQPKLSSTGNRSIGLTSSERQRKRAMNRSLDLDYPRASLKFSPKRSPKSPRQKFVSRTRSRSPMK